MEKVTVIGAGSWGTALGALLAEKGHEVVIWARESEVAGSITRDHENKLFLPRVLLPYGLRGSGGIEEALEGAEVIVSAVPTQGLQDIMGRAMPFISNDTPVISATKGIELGTLRRPSEILSEVLGTPERLAVLSGPTFAREVSRKLPSAVVAASSSEATAKKFQSLFSVKHFRVYTNSDMIGVEFGGALKNVIAIATGISDGLQLGHNARAALITRGLAEITRLGVKLGAETKTFSGLSGMGDLVLTATGPMSRNYSVGMAIGSGSTLEEITAKTNSVAEGVKTAEAVTALAAKHSVEMPIANAVCAVLAGETPPEEAVYELMTRDLKVE